MTITSNKLRHWATCAACTEEGTSPLGVETLCEIAAHIDAQAARIAELEEEAGHYKERYWVSQRELAARIAEQQAVIDQRNGECDRLIKQLAALREQKTLLCRTR